MLLFLITGTAAYSEGEPGLHYVNKKLEYCDSSWTSAASVGIDTSYYNGKVDWKELKKIGIDFALIRVGGRGWGNGALYTDAWFLNSLKSAKNAGLRTGVYFYSMAVNRNEAIREAQYVLERLDRISLDMPVYYDMEFSGDYPKGRADGLANAERVDLALAFCETIEQAGYKAGVYANESFFHDELNLDALSDYSIWVASYTLDNVQPAIKHYDIWQYTDSVRIPGVNGNCDLDVIFEIQSEKEE